MLLCQEVPCTAVENLTLATPALGFKLHAHTVGEGTIFAKIITILSPSVKKMVILCIPKGNGGNAGGMTLRYRKQMGQTTLKTCGGTGAQPAQNGKGGKGKTFLLFVCFFFQRSIPRHRGLRHCDVELKEGNSFIVIELLDVMCHVASKQPMTVQFDL